jgi:uncharacterized lipoprotein
MGQACNSHQTEKVSDGRLTASTSFSCIISGAMKLLLIGLAILALAGCSGSPPAPQQQPQAQPAPAPEPKEPNEAATMEAIAAVNAAQKNYIARYRRYALSYEELMQGVFLKEEPVAEKTGYEIKLRPSADAARYTIIATPANHSTTARHFFSDQTRDIRAELGKDANAQSPTVTLRP